MGARALRVGLLWVDGVSNDYLTGGKAHPFDFLEWSTVLECEAPVGAESGAVVDAVTDVLEVLWCVGGGGRGCMWIRGRAAGPRWE